MVNDKETEERVLVSIPVSKGKAFGSFLIGLAILGGSIGYPIINSTTTARYDAFTSEQATELRAKITRLEVRSQYIIEIAKETRELRELYHSHKHEAPPIWVREKLKSVEMRLERLERK